MKEKLQIRCPFCGRWYTYRRGISIPRGEGFVALKDIDEVPKFNLLDITNDVMVRVVIGRAVIGSYCLVDALLNLDHPKYTIIKNKLIEISHQCSKIDNIVKSLKGGSNG